MLPREFRPQTGSAERVESVSQLTVRIKALLEREIAPCWVRGEVSNLRVQASGHVYLSLKDAGAQVSAVLFRGDAARQTVKLRDGLQILAFGGLSLYEPRGQYQLVVRAVIEDGVGRLQMEFEALKRRLAAEGLFDPERKRPLPALPARVGFVTSPTGAAVRDFVKILQRRCWRGRCVVLPSKVQGSGAAEEMAAMLAWAADLRLGPAGEPVEEGAGSPLPRFFDLLVVGRGGGSLEDLWAFNEEVLVRAVAACPVPTVSAVGHEIDFTLCDFAADQRAETPSGAAELISSRFLEILQRAEAAAESLEKAADRALDDARGRLEPLRGRLRLLAPAAQVERGYLRLDDLSNRLLAALRHAAQDKRAACDAQRARFERASPENRVQFESHRLLALYKRLQSASPQSVLNRGFVIMRDAQGAPLARRAEVTAGQRIRAQFADGDVGLKAD
ncbi:exodeoxyribonuclease 7 large subunit [mine drainage metagenome]|uniref:Exodeoxyribonuclease 7 large subunit n=1 Tax=mine drainage metagenome TaxID=410659 RepID=A0A1J5SJA1_9ZZZZ